MTVLRALIVEDNPDDAELITLELRRSGYVPETIRVDTLDQLRVVLRQPWDVIYSDFQLEGVNALDVLDVVRRELRVDLPFIVVSGTIGEDIAVQALQHGADDYFRKEHLERLAAATARSLRESATRRAAREAERRARQLERDLTSMANAAPLAIAMISRTRTFTFQNAEFARLFGTSAGGAAVVPALFSAADLDEAFATGRPLTRRERTVIAPDAGAHVVNVVFVPVSGEGDATVVESVTVLVVDLTREVELRRAAEQADRLKDEFLLTLSHELRTPLNTIVGWTSLLRENAVPDDRRPHAIETVARAAAAQTRLVDELLDISRIRTGSFEIERKPVDLADVVGAAVEAARSEAAAHRVELVLELQRPAELDGDRARLEQAIGNVLANAIKFSGPGTRVTVALDHADGRARLRVVDQGPGIEPEFLPYVFDSFRQADGSITRRHGGLGIGMSIARKVVELHGGRVSAESRGRGTGATFLIELPLREAPSASVAPPSGPVPTLAGLRIALIEDNEDAREMTAAALELYGAQVRAAACAQEAIELLASWTPDVVVSDIGLPDRDGYALMRELRTRFPPHVLPAAAVTAYTSEEDVRRATAAGFQTHISKPVNVTTLVNTVAALAGGVTR